MTRLDSVYLDHHATTPVDHRVFTEMLPYFSEVYGNAASPDHRFGADAREAVEQARFRIGRVIGSRADEIVFTSGATEANNLALTGVIRRQPVPSHVVASAVEHKAILDCLDAAAADGTDVTLVRVDSHGMVCPDDVGRAIRTDTCLVSIMAANNEVGTLQRIQEIGEITKSRGVLFHTDATQAVGYGELDVKRMNIDLLSASAHKCYGPKGIGFLYVSRRKPRVSLEPLLHGGGHEGGVRSGTLNVPGIVGMGAALALAEQLRGKEAPRLAALCRHMRLRLEEELGECSLHGHPSKRLPNNLNLGFDGIRAKALVVNLPELAFSTGSACTSAKAQPSHVLRAMGLSDERVKEAVRFGLGRSTTIGEVDYAVERLVEVVRRLRSVRLA
ncbi:MAG: cysteine desulfurase family protein [Gammaproteobacteria bacterium]|nr:cysteine desulfurase family protein [Gammaproteobacteria bacterium]